MTGSIVLMYAFWALVMQSQRLDDDGKKVVAKSFAYDGLCISISLVSFAFKMVRLNFHISICFAAAPCFCGLHRDQLRANPSLLNFRKVNFRAVCI